MAGIYLMTDVPTFCASRYWAIDRTAAAEQNPGNNGKAIVAQREDRRDAAHTRRTPPLLRPHGAGEGPGRLLPPLALLGRRHVGGAGAPPAWRRIPRAAPRHARARRQRPGRRG